MNGCRCNITEILLEVALNTIQSINSFNLDNLKFFVWKRVHPSPNDKMLALTKLKAFADDKFSVVEMTISVFEPVYYPFYHIVFKGSLFQSH